MTVSHSTIKTFLIKSMVWIPVDKILNYIENIRLERLKKRIQHVGKGVVISPDFIVQAPENLVIKDEVSFARDVKIMGTGHVMIKRETMIGSGVTILTTTHDSHAKKMRETGIHKDVTIGKYVWIGTNATILPGVTIHDGSIVGAGAVITKDISSGEVVVGPYARVIRHRNQNDNEGTHTAF